MDTKDESTKINMLQSADPQKRILARRQRRNKRLLFAEAKEEKENEIKISETEFPGDDILKMEIPLNLELFTEVTGTENKLNTQLQQSSMQLVKLLYEGTQMVINVRTANDTRESTRKGNETEKRKNQLKTLEEAATVSMEKFNKIAAKWKNIVASNDPLDLYHGLIEQTKKCNELIEQKNLLAEDLRHEIAIADERFNRDKIIQLEDLRILTERINNQILVMKRAYKQELKLIEEAIEMECKELQEVQNKKWNLLYKEQDRAEKTSLEHKMEIIEKQEEEVAKIYQEHEEKFRIIKIQLETDIQILQQELSRIHPMCIYSSEKLIYNYQVLKKRAEESIILQAEQKRMLTRLYDTANNLRKSIAATGKAMETKVIQLQEELLKLQKKTSDTEQKAEHFMKVNDRQYMQIWTLNENNAQKILKKLHDVDRIIHEQQLGMDWVPPEKQLLKLPDLIPYCSETSLKEERLERDELPNVRKSPLETEYNKSASERLLYQIFSLLADSSGFLMANRLKDILKPYTKPNETLVKVDNIFTALGLHKEDDINLLKNFFIPYTVCQICDRKQTPSVNEDGQNLRDIPLPSLAQSRTKNCLDIHSPSMNPVLVLVALNNFVTSFATLQQRKATTLPCKQKMLSRILNSEDVAMFWARFHDTFPPECDKLWDGVIHGLQKYLYVLQNRHEINKEVEKLQTQNNELKRLLQNYIHPGNSDNILLQDSFVTSKRRIPHILKL